jgi:DNA-binding transcriptional LysR family regulator
MSANPWLGVEFRHLAALAAVQRTGSFRGAAEDLGYVQSAVSQQIARLEHLVDARLVERTRGTAPITLTAAGGLLLEHTDQILASFQAAQGDLAALSKGLSGTLRLGVFQSAATRLLPPVLRVFHERWPNVRVAPIETQSQAELVELMEHGALDLSFADLPLEAGPFDIQPLFSEPCVLLVSAGSPLARRAECPSLAEIARLPLIAHTKWQLLPRIREELRSTGSQPNFVIESNTNTAVQALVAEGIGSAIMPRLAVDLDDPRTVVFELDQLLPLRSVALFWHRERQRSAFSVAFCEAADEACARLFERDRPSALAA